MLKCKICGKEFEANIVGHYVSRDCEKTGIVEALSGNEARLFDTFDCPHCGCQVVVQERKREYYELEVDASETEDDGFKMILTAEEGFYDGIEMEKEKGAANESCK